MQRSIQNILDTTKCYFLLGHSAAVSSGFGTSWLVPKGGLTSPKMVSAWGEDLLNSLEHRGFVCDLRAIETTLNRPLSESKEETPRDCLDKYGCVCTWQHVCLCFLLDPTNLVRVTPTDCQQRSR